jgi:hypothetical protein
MTVASAQALAGNDLRTASALSAAKLTSRRADHFTARHGAEGLPGEGVDTVGYEMD